MKYSSKQNRLKGSKTGLHPTRRLQPAFLTSQLLFSTFILWTVIILLPGCDSDSEKIEIMFAGDLMLDRGTRDQINVYGMDYPFTAVKKILNNADITVANFECTACDSSLKPTDKKFTFRANPEWLKALHTNGITHVTLANNHSFDFGEEGLKQTEVHLKEHSINYLGYNPDSNFSCSPAVIEKNGNKIAIFSSVILKQESECTCDENPTVLAKRIQLFKQVNPSSLIFVCLHWGNEMQLEPSASQTEQAHLLITAGADAIIGHHPHVVQTIELFKGKYIFYSLGNFIFDAGHPPENRGIMAMFSLSKKTIESVRVIPFNIVKSKPELMNAKDSEKFMNEINTVSQTLNFKQSDGNWKVL